YESIPNERESPRDFANLSPLEQLPLEILSKVIDFAPRSVLKLRLISRALHSRVMEYSRSVPIVTELSVLCTTAGGMFVTIKIPDRNSALFNMRATSRLLQFNRIAREKHPFSTIHRWKVVTHWSNEDRRLWESIKEAVGKKVAKVFISHCDKKEMRSVVYDLIEEIQFDELKVVCNTLTNEDAHQLLNVIVKSNVSNLSMVVKEVCPTDPEKFLLDLSSAVRSIHIYQCWTNAKHPDYFFGMNSIDWKPIITEMFSKQLVRLCIENHHFKEYISISEALELKGHLTSLGKEIWLSHYPDRRGIGNYHPKK
ncbi:hypothetical protein PENTCL1PPCAC_18760, partial [Pristionchus entomophagus]